MSMPAVKRRWTAAEVRALVDENLLVTPRYELEPEFLTQPDVFVMPVEELQRARHILTDELTWNGPGATTPFRLGVPAYFARVLDS
jgi:hypothetical protein